MDSEMSLVVNGLDAIPDGLTDGRSQDTDPGELVFGSISILTPAVSVIKSVVAATKGTMTQLRDALPGLRETDLRALATTSFDNLWTAQTRLDPVEVSIDFLSDLGVDLGYEPGEFPRTASLEFFLERMPLEDREPFVKAVRHSLESGSDFWAEHRLSRKDGGDTWWEVHGTCVELEDGRPVRWVGTSRNITERKKAELELRQALSELKEIKSQLEAENLVLREEIEREHEFGDIVGKSVALKSMLQQAEQVARTNSAVLITGETGTGKELIARAIHQRSNRRDLPLVVVNCAALPSTLVESELFGHERGAFTGATATRIGRFERAHRGTIFLDEVGELPLDLQAKLLRVLQSGELERLGSTESRRVDVRVIAATNRDLAEEVKRGTFRQDLYYRLHVFPIRMPSLRERKEDIPLLIAYLVEKKARALGKRVTQIPREVVERLTRYEWPGNVRELENVIERAIILTPGQALRLDGVPSATDARPIEESVPQAGGLHTLEEIERAHILRMLEACRWVIRGPGAAAERLGLHPSTLYFRMKKLGIERPR